MGYTSTIIVNDAGTGVNTGKICEFDTSDIENLVISADNDIYWGYGDISQSQMPLSAGNSLVITHLDFSGQLRTRGKMIRIYAKRQAVGNANVYVCYQGRVL